MNKRQCLPITVVLTLVVGSGSMCMASEGDGKQKPKESKGSKDSSKKITPSCGKVLPAPSMSSDSPSFQSPLTNLIRTKGHADHARYRGDFTTAKKLYLVCVRDPNVEHRALGFCYQSLADIFYKEENFSEAEKYYKKALVQMKKYKQLRTVDYLNAKLEKLSKMIDTAKKSEKNVSDKFQDSDKKKPSID